jgi:hypothetical protein
MLTSGGEVTGAAEFCLALECCSRSFSGSEAATGGRLRAVDWDDFLRLVRFHRMEGLAWNALARAPGLPEEAAEPLRQAAAEIAARNLEAAAESRLLLNRFDAAKIPLMFLKGLTLGALAYRNPMLKSAVDIDLLIDPKDLEQTAEIMRECDFRLALPLDARRLHAWHRTRKESVWLKDGSAMQIDLHTRTADNPALIPRITAHSPTRQVKVCNGVSLPTLAADELFAYLAVHGASSAWFRLKWIADFAGLMHGQSAGEIQRLYERSQQLGAGRAAGQALLLADALFGTLETSPALRRRIGSDPPTRLLFRAALRQVSADPREPTKHRFGTFTIHWTQFLLLPGLRYKLSELAGQGGRALARSRS